MFTRSVLVPASSNVRMLDVSAGPSQLMSTGIPLLRAAFSRIFAGTS